MKKKKLAVLINVIAPYRVPILASLAEEFDTLVLHGGSEPNRTWSVELPPELKTRKVFTIQIPIRKKNGIDGVTDTTYLHLNLGLLWWLIRFRPKVILSSEMGIRTMIALLYGMVARVPVWVWWGGTLHSERNISRARMRLRRILALLITRWISYGASTTEYLESIGISRKRILQIQNCVPHETFVAAPAQASAWFMANPRPVILTVGQLVQRKGLDKLIEACGRLAARGRQFSLVIVGQGPELQRLYKLAKDKGIQDFAILPNQPQSTLNQIYRNSDVFVFPTLEDVWGLVVNEALWAGTPVLCSKYAGCAAELVPEANIFDPMSPDSFDSALAKVFKRTVSPPDTSRLRTWQEVADMITGSLLAGTPVRAGNL
jgi:glycosyltransferase involved in cell wall biosynthesis